MRRPFVLFLPLAALLATGCGTAPPSRSAPSQPQAAGGDGHDRKTGDPAAVAEGTGGSSGGFVFFSRADDTPPTPPHELYAVLRRPPRSSDLEAQRQARSDALLDPVGAPKSLRASFGKPL